MTSSALLPLRLVMGWIFFSAFWRRAILSDKLDPNVPGYVGVKFNNFLPHAMGIKAQIEYLLTHPDLLRIAMTVFTAIEGIVGLCLILGVFTRLMAFAAAVLGTSILLGAGWLGTTCLDEWQIGILALASGAVLFLVGGGKYSVDHILAKRYRRLNNARLRWFTSGDVELPRGAVTLTAAAVSVGALVTNQYFHGGVYGPLHNDSVKPVLEVSNASIHGGALRFDLARTAGPDTYGAFVVGLTLRDEASGKDVLHYDCRTLNHIAPGAISNRYIALVHTGPHSLVVPLGAKAMLTIALPQNTVEANHRYGLSVEDISGASAMTDVHAA